MKPLHAKKNHAGGYDLYTERDGGNPVLCLTGRYGPSLEYWKRLRQLADNVVYELENVNEDEHAPELHPI